VLCVVGPSGAGKSTLLAILLRLYDPSAGRVTFDGLDLRDLSLASLRERIALVPQDGWIVDGTIGENIAFGRLGTSPDDIVRAGRLAHVEEFVVRMPDGYDTRVGEDGRLLSGGQRRRLAIARAVARPSSVLLLDEPTSGLDAAAEASVLAALRSVADGRTVVVASHDPAVAARADRVVVLDGGRFVDQPPVRSCPQHEGEEVSA
jgi:ABC-type multidrug transport system fused ATPase/permease subunit